VTCASTGPVGASLDAGIAGRGRMPAEPLAGGDEPGEVLAFLARRYSLGPKYLTLPAPALEQLRQGACVALRAPDHRRLRPFRFVRVGDDQREALGRLFAADAAQRGHGAAEVKRARERAHNGPALLALIANIRPDADDVPAHEQWLCVGAGVMNYLNALHLMGYGAKLLSGASVRAPRIQAAFCRPGEMLVAWVLAGTPARHSTAKEVDDPDFALSEWHLNPADSR
jgi:nitroreductase